MKIAQKMFMFMAVVFLMAAANPVFAQGAEVMKEAAVGLQFEEAAKLRDEIKKLSELRMMV